MYVKSSRIFLLFVLALIVSSNLSVISTSFPQIDSISQHHNAKIGFAFAESGDNENNGTSNEDKKSSEQNNSNAEDKITSQSEDNAVQSGENNKTNSEHQVENETKTEHQGNDGEDVAEIENENNNENATKHATEQDKSDMEEAKTNQIIAAEVEIGDGNINQKSIDNNVMVKTENSTNDTVNLTVSATSQTGPKVILIDFNSTTIEVANMKYLHVMYDGHPITPAANVNEILHTTSSDEPRYAILVTQSGAQILISIPHFSTHTITIGSISKVIPSAVPEFGPIVGMMIVLSVIGSMMMSRKFSKI